MLLLPDLLCLMNVKSIMDSSSVLCSVFSHKFVSVGRNENGVDHLLNKLRWALNPFMVA